MRIQRIIVTARDKPPIMASRLVGLFFFTAFGDRVHCQGEDAQLAVKVRLSSRTSTVMVSPSLNSLCNIFDEIGLST